MTPQIFNPDGSKNTILNDEADAQWFNLATVLEYYGIFENLAVRDSLALF